ncbi:MAG TPA: hypothetical protein EYP09_01345 [Anaerolineae bacterium]|nr:hypothetical protein [Anaerolineae bacterium]
MDRAELQEWMVRRAEDLIRRLKEATGWDEAPDVGKTQTSKAIEVAQAAASPLLFIHWLRYQAAREGARNKFWSRKLAGDNKTLAEAITEDVNELKGKSPAGELMENVALYLGYFRRALIGLKYLDKIRDP